MCARHRRLHVIRKHRRTHQGRVLDGFQAAGILSEGNEGRLLRHVRVGVGEAHEAGLIDRPIEILYREVEGLPKGTVKAVIDAFGELVDEGCLAVFGPHITDNCVPTREAIEERFRVPALSVTGSDEWLGEWTFAFPQGSLTDEPIFWADLLAKGGHSEVGVLVEQSLVGDSYVRNFRKATRRKNIRI